MKELETEIVGKESSVESHLPVILRTVDGVRYVAAVPEWTALQLIASISADPRNVAELEAASRRYRPGSAISHWLWREGLPAPSVTGWLAIDLVSQRLLSGGDLELPEGRDRYEATEEDERILGEVIRKQHLYFNFPPHWTLTDKAELNMVLEPAAEPAPRPDVRAILYGQPLVESLARFAREEFLRLKPRRRTAIVPGDVSSRGGDEMSKDVYVAVRTIHKRWLLGQREDLFGDCPRKFLHGIDEWVNAEMENRAWQWSHERRAPPTLDRSSFAYQYGGIGPNERLVYFYLCRRLIREAWNQLVAAPSMSDQTLIDVLVQTRLTWLRERCEDLGDIPEQIIERERRRLPHIDGGSHLDCECPICMNLANMDFGPAFTFYDGSELDLEDDYVFSNFATEEEYLQICGAWIDFEEEDGDDDDDDLESLEPSSLSGNQRPPA